MVFDRRKEIETDIQIKEIEKEMSVSEVMNKTVVTLDINTDIPVIAREMVRYNVGSVIITEKEKAMGIITERDLVRDIVTKDKKPSRVHASKIVSTPLVAVKPTTSVIEASEIMLKSDIKRLPVMENGDIVGIVSNTDILMVTPGLSTILKDLIEMNREPLFATSEGEGPEFNSGVCESCGYYSEDLEMVNGRLLCRDCRDVEEDYYD
ncbi:TPA: CBS domain-containing protein [Methanosarcinaceae archaeon]|nr:CBS domain-containing protein [Methanosarcinaceae archaeon]